MQEPTPYDDIATENQNEDTQEPATAPDDSIVQNRLRRLAAMAPGAAVKFSAEQVYTDEDWKVREAQLLQKARAVKVLVPGKVPNRAQRRA